ncbi:hypothetical protein HAX54_029510, partial [Datura stramonium]|nr:hypothetical protein [Datura stramonium]
RRTEAVHLGRNHEKLKRPMSHLRNAGVSHLKGSELSILNPPTSELRFTNGDMWPEILCRS